MNESHSVKAGSCLLWKVTPQPEAKVAAAPSSGGVGLGYGEGGVGKLDRENHTDVRDNQNCPASGV